MHSARTAIGTAISAGFRDLVAVFLQTNGRGLEMRAEVVASVRQALPNGIVDRIAAFVSDTSIRPSQVASLAVELASAEAEVVREAFSVANQVPGDCLPDPLVVGSGLPSNWHLAEEVPQAQIGLSDPARLAEICGMNVVDAFPSRDLAKGGHGGPIEPIAEWLLLHDTKRNRVLVNLGATVRMTYLPSGCESSVASDIMASDIVPGGNLLDSLHEKLTLGRQVRHDGNRMAVRGRCIEPLLEHLLAAPYFEAPPPRWHPMGAPTHWFLEESLRWNEKGEDVASDILCTATHFIAEAIARCLEQCVPRSPTPVQLLFSGDEEKNGLLLREICERLPPFDRTRFPETIKNRAALDAACTAVLAILHVDQTPQSLPRITGIHTPRVLGRLTPGSPRNWKRLVQEMAASAPPTMSLRCAL